LRSVSVVTKSEHILSCAQIVRDNDYDRYLSVLFAPKEKRAALFALYAFNYEVAKTAETVSDPTLGQIRLQWWREAVEGIYGGTPRRHEVVLALHQAVTGCGLPRAAFDRLIDARENDLVAVPFATLPEFEDYAAATSGGLMRLAAHILGASEPEKDRARPLGIAYAIVGLLRAFPFHAASGRIMIPASEFAAAGVNEEAVFEGKTDNIRTLIKRMVCLAEDWFANASARKIPRRYLAAYLPAALIGPYLSKMKTPGFDPYRESVDLSVPRKQFAMLGSVVRGGVTL
jgi:NADH dehydrogenase [ubiquinone] 1 alpha subcomplex assembly factor 6